VARTTLQELGRFVRKLLVFLVVVFVVMALIGLLLRAIFGFPTTDVG
jgi:hypothetical protein